MFTALHNEPTGWRRAEQARGAGLAAMAIAVAFLFGPTQADAQQLPFTITWVVWSTDALARQRQAYREEATRHEVLFCIERWHFETSGDRYRILVIDRARREAGGEAHRIDDIGPKCRNEKGEPLPTIHTHSDGNCQLSPSDLATIANRDALFDGVQCGETYFVWGFAWQIKAIATWVSISQPNSERTPSIP